MSYLVVMIVNNIDDCPAILNAWENLGIPGVTILETTGIGHLKKAGLMDNIPLMPSIQDMMEKDEVHHRTLFSVVNNHDMVERMIASVEEVTGDLDEPHTGFLFVLPVLEAYGMGNPGRDRSRE